ncbi:MAG: hypothetical protein AB7Q01_16580, partial [Gammaproteobacteria bacterium]
SAAVVVALMFRMAMPWSGSAPYDNLAGYLGLAKVVSWALSPYAWFYFSSYWQKRHPRLIRWRLALALMLGVGGLCLYVDAVFIHLDAQGALVFLFIPLYQWVGIGLSECMLRLAQWFLPPDRQETGA